MILNVKLCWVSLECARLLELHSSVSAAKGMSHYWQNQTTVSYSSQLLTKTDTSVVVAAFVKNLLIDAKRRSSK